jgi:EAL domain-containing protein (putative c-di-GMP-specific phosphodiesterase class I)
MPFCFNYTLVAMAKALGVKTQEQKDCLMTEGCDYLQGYLICKPVSSIELENRFLLDLKK